MLKKIITMFSIVIWLFIILIIIFRVLFPQKEIVNTWYKDDKGYIHYQDMIIPEEEFKKYNID